jgi:hypothetical protein
MKYCLWLASAIGHAAERFHRVDQPLAIGAGQVVTFDL